MENAPSNHWEDFLMGHKHDPEKTQYFHEVLEQNPVLQDLIENIPYLTMDQIFQAVGEWNGKQTAKKRGFYDTFSFSSEMQSSDGKLRYFCVKVYGNGLITISVSGN